MGQVVVFNFATAFDGDFGWILSSSPNADIFKVRSRNVHGFLSEHSDERMQAFLTLGMDSAPQPQPPAQPTTGGMGTLLYEFNALQVGKAFLQFEYRCACLVECGY